jgi:hypothetical protein
VEGGDVDGGDVLGVGGGYQELLGDVFILHLLS